MADLPPHLSKNPVGRERISPYVVDEHQRERILDAAIEVFAKRGYPNTTIDNILAAAKMGWGRFYAYFEDKETCFAQAFDRVVECSRERVAEAIPDGAPWEDQAVAALREVLEIIAEEPRAARLVLVEAQTAGPEAVARYEALLESLTPVLRSARGLSREGAELPESFEDASIAGVAWLLHQRIVAADLGDVDELLPDLVGILVEPYLGQRKAAALLAS
ncbi:MAG: TetR/AcrR family transcriptional regulator [Solirubrobacterales bacterium]